MDLETVRGLTVWFQFIGAAGAALTVIIGAATVFHKRVVRPWNAKLDAISDLVGLLPAIEELVRTEMTPNGGGSMKDQLARIPVLESQLEVDRVATDAPTRPSSRRARWPVSMSGRRSIVSAALPSAATASRIAAESG